MHFWKPSSIPTERYLQRQVSNHQHKCRRGNSADPFLINVSIADRSGVYDVDSPNLCEGGGLAVNGTRLVDKSAHHCPHRRVVIPLRKKIPASPTYTDQQQIQTLTTCSCKLQTSYWIRSKSIYILLAWWDRTHRRNGAHPIMCAAVVHSTRW